MPITPLPQFETDLAEHLKEAEDREVYERLSAPKTLVVRFGYLKMVGEFPWKSDVKPGCGSKIVVRTPRGTEIGEMLTSTCPNSGCSKSVSRKEMLDYIENSGGRQYPFYTDGKALRIATPDDLNRQAALDATKHEAVRTARDAATRLGLPFKVVEVEPILGDERLTVYYLSEERVDFRALVQELRGTLHDRIEMRQVGARDEARLTADYERCGQYCCCKNFLKVLKPISMRSAKIQKATLDPLKISGRCGRLMCCLRYEDETYDELRKKLPHRKTLVGTPEGDGIVIDSQILTQLVLVELDDTRKRVAIPVEDLTKPGESRPSRAAQAKAAEPRSDYETADTRSEPDEAGRKKRRRRRRKGGAESAAPVGGTPQTENQTENRPENRSGDRSGGRTTPPTESRPDAEGAPGPKKKRRRRRKSAGERTGERPGGAPAADSPATTPRTDSPDSGSPASGSPRSDSGTGDPGSGPEGSRPAGKKRRRRRRKPSGGSGGDSGGAPGGAPGGPGPGSSGGE